MIETKIQFRSLDGRFTIDMNLPDNNIQYAIELFKRQAINESILNPKTDDAEDWEVWKLVVDERLPKLKSDLFIWKFVQELNLFKYRPKEKFMEWYD